MRQRCPRAVAVQLCNAHAGLLAHAAREAEEVAAWHEGPHWVTPTTRRRHTPTGHVWRYLQQQRSPGDRRTTTRAQRQDSSQFSHARPSTRCSLESKLTARWWLHPHQQRRPPAQRHAPAPPPQFAAPRQERCCAWPAATESCQSGWRLRRTAVGWRRHACAAVRRRGGGACRSRSGTRAATTHNPQNRITSGGGGGGGR